MFRFEKEQKVFEIGGIKIGGQPGEYPTVLIGSIFYDKHKIVKDADKGEFDKAKAEALIKMQELMSDKTGNPCFFDVVGRSSESLIKYVDFIADATDAPFFVDGPNAAVRIPAIKHAFEIGLKDRAVYNSIDYTTGPEEVQALKELSVVSSVVVAFSKKNPWPEGKVEILRGSPGQKGLLDLASEAGIQNVLVDTAVIEVVGIGVSARAIFLVKNELGLPAGCGPANAVTTWQRIKKGEFGPHAYNVCVGGSAIVTQMMGANFVLYGPIELAEAAFPACAMTDMLIAYTAKRLGTTVKTKDHPIYRIA